jgi:hypothetical protein
LIFKEEIAMDTNVNGNEDAMMLIFLSDYKPGNKEGKYKYKDDDYASEYQKIMVLHVLYIIHSKELENYLDLADKSEYHYLKENAREIRQNMLKEQC